MRNFTVTADHAFFPATCYTVTLSAESPEAAIAAARRAYPGRSTEMMFTARPAVDRWSAAWNAQPLRLLATDKR